MSYPYPPPGPGQQPPGGWNELPPPPGGYGQPPGGYGPAGGYGAPPPAPGWPGQGVPGGPMGPPPMGGPPVGPPPSKGGGATVVVVIVVVVFLLVGGLLTGAYFLAGGGDGDTAARSTPSASSSSGAPASAGGQYKPGYYNSMKSWSLWDSLNTASADSRPMTLSEVFADAEAKSEKDTLDGTYFNLQGTGRLDTDCASTVWGPALKTALQSYGCTQVVRGAYVSSDRRWTGQLAVFNLKDVASANALLEDLDPKAGKGFFLPVTGPAPVDQFGKGSTGAESGAYGHFVVVGWAGHADGGQGSAYGTDTISPASTVQQAGKEFLFHRN